MSSRNLVDAVKELRDKFTEITNQFEFVRPGFTLNLTCTHRPPEEQFELFKKGRVLDINGHSMKIDHTKIVTNCDGINVLSPHNYYPSRAIDVVVINKEDHKAYWEADLYEPLLIIANNLELVSGGSWKSIKDWPHIEVKHYKDYSLK